MGGEFLAASYSREQKDKLHGISPNPECLNLLLTPKDSICPDAGTPEPIRGIFTKGCTEILVPGLRINACDGQKPVEATSQHRSKGSRVWGS